MAYFAAAERWERMTGKLLGDSAAKPKAPSEASSDDEGQAMLLEETHSERQGRRRKPNPWGFSIYQRHLPTWLPQRFALCVLAHLGFVLLYIMRSNMSVAVVRMTTPYAVLENDHMTKRVDFDWSLQQQGILLSSFFVGYILTQIPGGYLACTWGGRRIFGLGLFGASLVSILTPMIGISMGFYGFIIARFFCGVFEGVTYPAIHSMWNHWAPPLERASLVSGAFSGAYLGAALSMAQNVTAMPSMSWQELFYVSGCYSLLWCIVWFSWGAEDPEEDPLITEKEFNYLMENKARHWEDKLNIPWRKILLSPRVWAINVCHFAANWGFYTILTELPTFMRYALHYDVKEMAPVASLPFLAMAFSAAFGGVFIDKTLLRFLNTTYTRKVTVCITFLAQMMFFFLAGKATERHEFVLCFVGALFFGGLSWAGFSANHLDIAPDYASVLLGISNTIGTIPGIVSPLLTSYLVDPKDDPAAWSVVFLIVGYIYAVAAFFYVMFGSGEVQDWANSDESQKLTSSKKKTNDDEETGLESRSH